MKPFASLKDYLTNNELFDLEGDKAKLDELQNEFKKIFEGEPGGESQPEANPQLEGSEPESEPVLQPSEPVLQTPPEPQPTLQVPQPEPEPGEIK